MTNGEREMKTNYIIFILGKYNRKTDNPEIHF